MIRGGYKIDQPNRLEYNILSLLFDFLIYKLVCHQPIDLASTQNYFKTSESFNKVSFRHFTVESTMLSPIKQKRPREGGRVRQLSDDPQKAILDKKYSNWVYISHVS